MNCPRGFLQSLKWLKRSTKHEIVHDQAHDHADDEERGADRKNVCFVFDEVDGDPGAGERADANDRGVRSQDLIENPEGAGTRNDWFPPGMRRLFDSIGRQNERI